MSITRNRELSQFGSFIYIDNATKSIGIATETVPNIGIGTFNATSKLHVIGNTNINGNLTVVNGNVEASSFTLNGNSLVNAEFQTWQLNGSDAYRINGNIGIGTSIPSQKLNVIGNVSAGQFISTVTTGTSPLSVTSQTLVTNLNADYLRGGIPGSNINSFDIVTLGATQTLSNKTLVTPKISSISNVGTLNLPTTNGTLVSTGDTAVVTSNMIADLSITNTDVAIGAGITYGKLSLSNSITNNDIASNASIAISKLAASTISGVSLGSSLFDLSLGSFLSYNIGTSFNGSASRIVSVAATTTNTANTVVARNASGDFTAGTINVTNLSASQTVQGNTVSVTNVSATNGNFSGIVTATDFNSTSDLLLKENIKSIENSLEVINELRGVSFNWKQTHKPSIGVIAQELEEVLPELVSDGEIKSVNYNGLIGVLIEAVKQLSKELEELKANLNK